MQPETKTRLAIATLVFMQIQTVIFGVGAFLVLRTSSAHAAMIWLPVVIVASSLISAALSWQLAPRLRARYWRARRAVA